MITMRRLVNTLIKPHSMTFSFFFFFFYMVRALKIYSLRNFQVYNILLLTIVIMLFITSPGLIHLIARSVAPSINISPFLLLPPALGNHHSTFYFYNFSFLKFHIQFRSYGMYFSDFT